MQSVEPIIYQGQFGEFIIDDHDRREVIIYRVGLMIAAVSFALGSSLVLWQGTVSPILNLLFALFSLGLGISLLTIHIYLIPLHRLLQFFWLAGSVSGCVLAWQNPEPLVLFVYENPLTLFGVGFLFVALTGIYFKEAFCFNRLETKFLTPLVPFLLLGHLFHLFSSGVEQILLSLWTILFLVFVLRKALQPIPPDIGDKSVFEHLKKSQSA